MLLCLWYLQDFKLIGVPICLFIKLIKLVHMLVILHAQRSLEPLWLNWTISILLIINIIRFEYFTFVTGSCFLECLDSSLVNQSGKFSSGWVYLWDKFPQGSYTSININFHRIKNLLGSYYKNARMVAYYNLVKPMSDKINCLRLHKQCNY